jgi:hypothetical protein
MHYDNNGDVLLACRSGRTREQLQAMEVPTTDSQLLLLEVYGLLSKNQGVMRTAIPILDPEQTLRIRQYASDAAAEMIAQVRSDVVEFTGLLAAVERERNAYSILFAYVFDDMVWGEFRSAGLVRPRTIDVDHPLWAGEVYAFYPRRSFSCGTNTYSSGHLALHLNWSQVANPLLGPFYDALRALDDAAFEDFVENGYTEDTAVIEAFMPFGMFEETGRLTIPVIEETADNALYAVSRRMSNTMAEQTLALLSFEDLQQEFGFRDIQQTMVIVFHELIWDLMDAVEAEGLVRKPVAFANPEAATSENVADLLFAVRSVDKH